MEDEWIQKAQKHFSPTVYISNAWIANEQQMVKSQEASGNEDDPQMSTEHL